VFHKCGLLFINLSKLVFLAFTINVCEVSQNPKHAHSRSTIKKVNCYSFIFLEEFNYYSAGQREKMELGNLIITSNSDHW